MPVSSGRAAPFLLGIYLFLIGLTPNVAAQSGPKQPKDELPLNEFGTFAVIPLANGSLKGATSDRHFYFFGLSYNRLLGHSRVCDVRWTSEIMPVEILSEPFIKGTDIQTLKSVPPFTETKVTYGLGANPVGADVVFLPDKRWQLFTGVHSGISYFTRNVLAAHAAQFNFMLDGRAGLRFPLHGGKAISVAYMFQHMSNAYTARENPGVDSHMIQVAYTFPFRFKH